MWLFADARNPSCYFYEALGGKNLISNDGRTDYGNYGWRDLRGLRA